MVPADMLAGALLGSAVGYGLATLKNKGFKGSFADAGSTAKMFAGISGIQSLVSCFLMRLRGKDDAINAGIAGCCTGLALTFPGTPQGLLKSCLMLGALSYVLEGINKQQPALAQPSMTIKDDVAESADYVLLPFSLHLPYNLLESFLSFRESLNKPRAGAAR